MPTTHADRAADRSAAPKSERTRERIILAAAVTLSRLGYAGTRLSDVADEAGVQAPAIYYYFGSREQLIEEVVTVGTIHLRDFVIAAVDSAAPDATALDRIDIAVDAHLRQLMSESSFAHAVIRNVGQLPDSIRGRQLVEERTYVRFWRELFQAARQEGALRPGIDPELAQLLIVGALNWATEWWAAKHGPLENLIATAQAIIRRGIEADGGHVAEEQGGTAPAPVPTRAPVPARAPVPPPAPVPAPPPELVPARGPDAAARTRRVTNAKAAGRPRGHGIV